MYLDTKNMFSDRQSVSVTTESDSPVDIKATGLGLSAGLFVAAEGFFGTGSMVVELLTGDHLTPPYTIATFPVSNAALKAGGMIVAIGLPRGTKRYVRLKYVVGGELAGGLISAGLVRQQP